MMVLFLTTLAMGQPADSGALPPRAAALPAGLVDLVTSFSLPPPERGQPRRVLSLWSTHFALHEAAEVEAGRGIAVLDGEDRPFPRHAPVHLTRRDWCSSALQGSARVSRLDGSVLTIQYATSGSRVVDCGAVLGNAQLGATGTVRFEYARGPWGDGVLGYRLVPYRSIATDPEVVPTGTLLYVPEARDVPFWTPDGPLTHDGWFLAVGVGGAIEGDHIDTFVGTGDNPFPHVASDPDERFDAWVVGASHLFADALKALHGR